MNIDWRARPSSSWTTLPPALLLALSLLITLLLGKGYERVTAERDQLRLELAVQATEDRIRARLDAYTALLSATRGLMAADPSLDAEHFRRFVGELDLERRYAGIQGVGYSRRFPWSEREVLEAEVARAGQPSFRVWPDQPREEGHSIVFLEPLSRRNQAALGYDMFTEPTRRAAMERARDSGAPAASGPIQLIQEIDASEQVGFLLYLPIYRDGVVPDTVEERRAQLQGFLYSPFRMGDLLAGIFGSEREPRIAFTVHEKADEGAVETYRSEGFGGTGRLSTVRPLLVAGRTWTLSFETTPVFERGAGAWATPYIYGIGVVLSGVFWWLARRQRRAEGQLRLHSRILSSMTEGVSVSDERGVIIYTNPAEDQMFGYAPSELLGRHVTALNAYPPEENDRIFQEIVRELGEKGSWSGEFANVRKDGTPFFTHAHISALGVGGKTCWICVQQDVTERRRAQQEREELLARETAARAAAEEASRVKDEFLAMLGHELRNPLAPIVTALALLKRRGDASDPAFSVLDRQVKHLRRLVDDLLDVSRITRGRVDLQRSRVEVAAVIEEAVELVAPLIEQRQHTLEVDVTEPLALEADRCRLVQILANLLNNAAKYTEPGGRICVRAERAGAEIVLRVRDNGVGISQDLLPRLFDPFTQGARSPDRSQGGLGLGLAIARSLVELHGGSITARSDGPGRGSELEVRLPAERTADGA